MRKSYVGVTLRINFYSFRTLAKGFEMFFPYFPNVGKMGKMNFLYCPNLGKQQKMYKPGFPNIGKVLKMIFYAVPRLGKPKNEYLLASQHWERCFYAFFASSQCWDRFILIFSCHPMAVWAIKIPAPEGLKPPKTGWNCLY